MRCIRNVHWGTGKKRIFSRFLTAVSFPPGKRKRAAGRRSSAWKKRKTEPLKIWSGYKRITENLSLIHIFNDKELMHFSYTRYLENKIRDTFGFKGTSLKFIIRERKEKE